MATAAGPALVTAISGTAPRVTASAGQKVSQATTAAAPPEGSTAIAVARTLVGSRPSRRADIAAQSVSIGVAATASRRGGGRPGPREREPGDRERGRRRRDGYGDERVLEQDPAQARTQQDPRPLWRVEFGA